MKAFSLALAIVASLLAVSAAEAANSVFTWNGGDSGNWNDSANWLCDGAATDRWPGKDTSSQNNTDEVRFDGVKATITMTSTTYVKVFMLTNHADITITSDETKRTLFVYGGGMRITDSELTFNTAIFYHSTGSNQWGCGDTLTFNGDSVLTLRNSNMYNGRVSANKCYVVRCYESSSCWYRYDNTLPSFDYLLDNSSFSGYASDSRLHASGDSKITFVGATPKMYFYKATQVAGTLTLRYVLPASPYASAPAMSQNKLNFENASGSVKIEIDPDSPGLTSGVLQTYRLISCDKDITANGIVLDNFSYPTMRTKDEVFTGVWKSGAAATTPPQYLDLTVDGAYDPDNAPFEATFQPAASFRPEMRFGGNISSMGTVDGVAASKAELLLEYGSDAGFGTVVDLGAINAVGDFMKSYSGFDATSTYYYRLILTNDVGQAVTSAVSTCSHICGTQLSEEVSASMKDGRGSVTGSVYVIGAGVTTVRLWLGRSENDMFEVANFTVSATGVFSTDIVYPNEGKWYYKFTSENSYQSQHWEDASGTSFVTVTDSNTYTWKGGDGDFYDKAKWTCGVADSGIGFPTSASSVVFPSNTTATIQITNSATYANVKFMQDDSDYTFVGNGATFGMYNSSCGGSRATLTLNNVKFTDPNYIWSGGAYFSANAECDINLLNGSRMVYKNYWLSGTNTTLYIGAGSSLEFALGGFYSKGTAAVVSNGNFYVGNPVSWNCRTFTLLGETPYASFTRNNCSGMDFEITLPSDPYAVAPIYGSSDPGTFANDAETRINVNSSVARRTGGTYRLIKWGLKSDASATAFGINTNNVVITGLHAHDSYSWSWEPGSIYESLGPQYLDVHIAKYVPGIKLILR